MILLKGKQINLRSMTMEDVDIILNWENDPKNWLFSGTLSPFTSGEINSFIKNSELGIYQTKQFRFIIELHDGKTALGTMDIFDFDPHNKRAGLGILIADESKRGLGYGKQALGLAIEYCFKQLDLHQIYCNILSDNQESIALFQSLGFNQCGHKKDWIWDGTNFKDELIFQFIKS